MPTRPVKATRTGQDVTGLGEFVTDEKLPDDVIDASSIIQHEGTLSINASQLNAGTLADGRLSSNVALLNGGQSFSAFSMSGDLTMAGSGISFEAPPATARGSLRASAGDARIQLDLATGNSFQVTTASGVSELFRVDESGSVISGLGSTAPNRVSDFLYISTSAGPPTGVPSAASGRVPIAFDTVNNSLHIYNGGWREIGAVGDPPPAFSSVTPSVGNQGDSALVLTIDGASFVSGATVSFSGTGITQDAAPTFVNSGRLTVPVSIAAGATVSARDLTIQNPDAQQVVASGAFNVRLPAPSFSSVTPVSGDQGASALAVTVNGSNFVSGATVSFSGSGITLDAPASFVSASELSMNISIAAGASVGAGNITVTNPDTQSDDGVNAFSVTAVGDITAPVLQTATVNDTSLVLTYDEALDGSAPLPLPGDFSIPVPAGQSVSAVAITGSAVTLTLSPGVANGDTVAVTYNPGTNPVEDLAGNDAASLSAQPVTNNTPDTRAPVFSSASVNGTSMVLTYDEALDSGSEPLPTQFTVGTGGVAQTVSGVAITGSAVTLTLSPGVAQGDAITIDYVVPVSNPLQDAAGNNVASLSGQAVTNNTTGSALGTRMADWTLVVGQNSTDATGNGHDLTWDATNTWWTPPSHLFLPEDGDVLKVAIVAYGQPRTDISAEVFFNADGGGINGMLWNRFPWNSNGFLRFWDSPVTANNEFHPATGIWTASGNIFAALRYDQGTVNTWIGSDAPESFTNTALNELGDVSNVEHWGRIFGTNGGRILIYTGANIPSDAEMITIRQELEGA